MYINAQKLKFIKVAIKEVLHRNPLRFSMMLLFGFLSGIFGGIGIGAIIPLFSLISGKSSEYSNIITSWIEIIFGFLHVPVTVPWLILFIAGLFIAKAIVQFTAKYLNIKTTAEYEERIRRDLFSKTLHATWPFLLRQKSGYLERILVNDVASGASMILRATNLVLLCTTITMYLVVAFSISVRITALTLAMGLILLLAFRPFLSRTRKIAKTMADTEKDAAHHIGQALSGAKILKSFGVEASIIQRSRDYFHLLREVRVKTGFYQYALGQAFEPIGLIFIVFLFIFYQQFPNFNIVSFAAIVYLVEKMFVYLQAAQGELYTINEMAPYLKAFVDFRSAAEENREINNGLLAFNFTKEIDFNSISFSYTDNRKILSGINFSIAKGEMIGLIGPSGAGKTTVADLLLRLFSPSSGKILIDGTSIDEIDLVKWRDSVRYVSQDIFLLNDTIENNIKFFDNTLNHDDIVTASQMANIYDFINSLPEGFNTIIGERGVMLSGGERQRIALARALVRIPDILILDEATSSLDSESEALIQGAIEKLRGRVTILVIAHRLSTILNSNRIVVIEDGNIIEQGDPGELLKNTESRFHQFYHAKKSY